MPDPVDPAWIHEPESVVDANVIYNSRQMFPASEEGRELLSSPGVFGEANVTPSTHRSKTHHTPPSER